MLRWKNKFLPLIFSSHSCFCNSAIARGSHRQDPSGTNSTENLGLPEHWVNVEDKSGEELLATGTLPRGLRNSGSRNLGKRGIQRDESLGVTISESSSSNEEQKMIQQHKSSRGENKWETNGNPQGEAALFDGILLKEKHFWDAQRAQES